MQHYAKDIHGKVNTEYPDKKVLQTIKKWIAAQLMALIALFDTMQRCIRLCCIYANGNCKVNRDQYKHGAVIFAAI